MEKQSRFAGLSAMERLDLAGRRAAFDAAAAARSRSEMIRLLIEVDFPDAGWTVDMIIPNPRRYGY